MINKFVAYTAVIASVATQAYADKCYALAFSSGDESSAYQAGVLKGLIEQHGADGTAYSAISGVSGGAINAALLANYEVGQESAAADRMVTFWQNASNAKLYKDWLGGLAEGLLVKGGLYNNAPTLEFLKNELADVNAQYRWIDVGLTDVLKGTYTDFFEGGMLTGDNLYEVMFAQFAQAGVFPPVAFNDTDYYDGSTIWDLDVFSVVNKCQETHADADIVVDVILTTEHDLKQVDASKFNSIQMLWRYLHVARYYNNMDGLLRARFAYPNIEFRHVIAPSSDLPDSMWPLNLDQSQIDQMVSLGEQDGKSSSPEASSNATEDVFHFFGLKKKQDERIKGVKFDDFKTMKQNGAFAEFKLTEDEKLAALFLQ